MLQTFKQHIIYICLSILLCLFSAASIIKFTDPAQAGTLTFVFLYSSIFLSVVGIFTLLGLLLRLWLVKGVYIVNLANSFRQGILIAALVLALLILSSQGILYWWVAISLVAFVTAVEILLGFNKKN